MTADEVPSTRERLAAEIFERTGSQRFLSVWSQTNVIEATPDDEWARMHAGVCAIRAECGPARLYPCGWRCEDHRPGAA